MLLKFASTICQFNVILFTTMCGLLSCQHRLQPSDREWQKEICVQICGFSQWHFLNGSSSIRIEMTLMCHRIHFHNEIRPNFNDLNGRNLAQHAHASQQTPRSTWSITVFRYSFRHFRLSYMCHSSINPFSILRMRQNKIRNGLGRDRNERGVSQLQRLGDMLMWKEIIENTLLMPALYSLAHSQMVKNICRRCVYTYARILWLPIYMYLSRFARYFPLTIHWRLSLTNYLWIISRNDFQFHPNIFKAFLGATTDRGICVNKFHLGNLHMQISLEKYFWLSAKISCFAQILFKQSIAKTNIMDIKAVDSRDKFTRQKHYPSETKIYNSISRWLINLQYLFVDFLFAFTPPFRSYFMTICSNCYEFHSEINFFGFIP